MSHDNVMVWVVIEQWKLNVIFFFVLQDVSPFPPSNLWGCSNDTGKQ